MSKASDILDRMKNGEFIIGTHVNLSDISISELMGALGFEFVWIEGEHSHLDKQTILNHIIACKAANTAAFVRIPWNDPVLAKPVLEMGLDGIIFPFICTAEEAKAAVAACTYPPNGVRGYGPKRAGKYGTMSSSEYLADVDKSFLKIMQIEHVDAVNNLEKIIAVNGVDTIVVGPNDLSCSIGLTGQPRHPDVMALMDTIAKKCKAANMPFGVSMTYDKNSIADWIRRGVSWMAAGNDINYIAMAGKETIKTIREIKGS